MAKTSTQRQRDHTFFTFGSLIGFTKQNMMTKVSVIPLKKIKTDQTVIKKGNAA